MSEQEGGTGPCTIGHASKDPGASYITRYFPLDASNVWGAPLVPTH